MTRVMRATMALAFAGVVLLPEAGLHAAGVPPAQQQLQQVLAQRHRWWLKLEAEKYHAALLQRRLSASQRALLAQHTRLVHELRAAAARRAQLLSAIEADQVRITEVGSAIVAARHEYVLLHRRAAGLLLKLKELKAEIHRQQGNVRAAVVQMYEMSQVSPLETVLEAGSLTALMQQQSYVGEIGKNDYATLQQAGREHAAVYSVAAVYIDEMAELRALQRHERKQLRAIKVDTRHEDRLLTRAEKLAARRQRRIRKQEAKVQALTNREQKQLLDVSTSARADITMIESDQQAADEVALSVERQTGTVPPGVWPGTTELAAQAALTAQAYLGQVKSPITPTGYWSGYCEAFAQFVYGEAFEAYSAIDEYQTMKSAGYIQPGIPLRGALVFYGGGRGYGHVAISLGGGHVISTMGFWGDKMPIAENPYLAFPDYLGWAMPF